MPEESPPQSSIILYPSQDGRTRIQCRFQNETLWLTQALIAELFEVTPQNVTLHLQSIYQEGELDEAATCKDYLQVRSEGGRSVSRALRHSSLPAILAIGYRVRSHRGTQFRRWATARLSEYLVKGFVMDDERLKNPPGKGQRDYFDDLLERIRDIRSSERRFYQKVLDIYATSIDYTPNTEMSQQFFAAVQNKMHWASHGHTAAEVIHQRADATQPLMGLKTTRKGRAGNFHPQGGCRHRQKLPRCRRTQPPQSHRHRLSRIRRSTRVNRQPMTMRDWIAKLDDFLQTLRSRTAESCRQNLRRGRQSQSRNRI